MPSVTDLNAVFADLERLADAYGTPNFPGRLGPTPQARRARHHLRVVGAAMAVAATVVAVAVAVTVVATSDPASRRGVGPGPHITAASTRRPTSTPSPRSSGPDLRRMSFSLDPVNGFTEIETSSFVDRQQRLMYYYGTGDRFAVALYPAGGFVPPRPAGATPVRTLGRPGFYGVLRTLPGHQPGAAPVGLAVQVGPHRWATVVAAQTGPLDNRSTPLQIAEVLAGAIHLTNATLAVPVYLTVAPPGLVLQASFGGTGEFRLRPGDSGQTAYSVEYARTVRSGTVLSIDVQPWAGGSWTGSHFTVDGHPAVRNANFMIRVGAYVVVVTITSGPAALTADQRFTVVKGLRFAASLTDSRTWFDAETALP